MLNNMVTKIEIKNYRTKGVIFAYECEDNTIKKTVEEAVRQNISLANASLIGADLSGTNLMYADLIYADLREANLSNANLIGIKFHNANFYRANLRNADLKGANLSGANFFEADLREAKLNCANLSCAKLNFTNLICADLYNAILSNANLDWSDLSGATINYPLNLPEGEFIAWKKVYSRTSRRPYIIKLKILADSKRSRATTDKCRCDKALVMEIQTIKGGKSRLTEITNHNYAHCTYKVGEIVEADSWDENRFNECTHGIHFFLDKQKAVNYLG